MNDGPPCCQIVELRKTFIRCTKLEDRAVASPRLLSAGWLNDERRNGPQTGVAPALTRLRAQWFAIEICLDRRSFYPSPPLAGGRGQGDGGRRAGPRHLPPHP